MSNPEPVSLSDDEFDHVQRYAAPLAPADRSHFLATVATRLRAEPTVGPGLIARICGELQRPYLDRIVGPAKTHAPTHSFQRTGGSRRRNGN